MQPPPHFREHPLPPPYDPGPFPPHDQGPFPPLPYFDERSMPLNRSFAPYHHSHHSLPPTPQHGLYRQHSFQNQFQEPPPSHPLPRNRSINFHPYSEPRPHPHELQYGKPIMLYQDPDLSLRDLPPKVTISKDDRYSDGSSHRYSRAQQQIDQYLERDSQRQSRTYRGDSRSLREDESMIGERSRKSIETASPTSRKIRESPSVRSQSKKLERQGSKSKKNKKQKKKEKSVSSSEQEQTDSGSNSSPSSIEIENESDDTHSYTESEIISKYGEQIKQKIKVKKGDKKGKKKKVYKKVIIITDGEKNILKNILSSEYQDSNSTKIKAGSQNQDQLNSSQEQKQNSQLRKVGSLVHTADTRSTKIDDSTHENQVADLNENNLKQFQQQILQNQLQNRPNYGLTEQQFQVISNFLKHYPVDDLASLKDSRISYKADDNRSVDNKSTDNSQDILKIISKVLQYYKSVGESGDKADQIGELNRNLEQLLKELKNEKQSLNLQDVQDLISNQDILTQNGQLSQQEIAEQNSVVLMALNPLFAQQEQINDQSAENQDDKPKEQPKRFSQKYQTPPKEVFQQDIPPPATTSTTPTVKRNTTTGGKTTGQRAVEQQLLSGRRGSGGSGLKKLQGIDEQKESQNEKYEGYEGSIQSRHSYSQVDRSSRQQSESEESMDSALLVPQLYPQHRQRVDTNERQKQKAMLRNGENGPKKDYRPDYSAGYMLRKQSQEQQDRNSSMSRRESNKSDMSLDRKGSVKSKGRYSDNGDVDSSIDRSFSSNIKKEQNPRDSQGSFTRQKSTNQLNSQASMRSYEQDSPSYGSFTRQTSISSERKSFGRESGLKKSYSTVKEGSLRKSFDKSTLITKDKLIAGVKFDRIDTSKNKKGKEQKVERSDGPIKELASKWQKSLRNQGGKKENVNSPANQVKQITFQEWQSSHSQHGMQRARSFTDNNINNNSESKDPNNSGQGLKGQTSKLPSQKSIAQITSQERSTSKSAFGMRSSLQSEYSNISKDDSLSPSPLSKGVSIDMKSKFQMSRQKTISPKDSTESQPKIQYNTIHQSLSKVQQLQLHEDSSRNSFYEVQDDDLDSDQKTPDKFKQNSYQPFPTLSKETLLQSIESKKNQNKALESPIIEEESKIQNADSSFSSSSSDEVSKRVDMTDYIAVKQQEETDLRSNMEPETKEHSLFSMTMPCNYPVQETAKLSTLGSQLTSDQSPLNSKSSKLNSYKSQLLSQPKLNDLTEDEGDYDKENQLQNKLNLEKTASGYNFAGSKQKTKPPALELKNIQQTLTSTEASLKREQADRTAQLTPVADRQQQSSGFRPYDQKIQDSPNQPGILNSARQNMYTSPRFSEISTHYSINSTNKKPPIGSQENTPSKIENKRGLDSAEKKDKNGKKYLEIPRSQYLMQTTGGDSSSSDHFLDSQKQNQRENTGLLLESEEKSVEIPTQKDIDIQRSKEQMSQRNIKSFTKMSLSKKSLNKKSFSRQIGCFGICFKPQV